MYVHTRTPTPPPPTTASYGPQAVMVFLPPPNSITHLTLESLIFQIQQHAGPEGYAIVQKRTKKSKGGLLYKAWLRCDRGGKPEAIRGGRGFLEN